MQILPTVLLTVMGHTDGRTDVVSIKAVPFLLREEHITTSKDRGSPIWYPTRQPAASTPV
jgi:hypothetical protein